MKYLVSLILILLVTGCGTSSEPVESGGASESTESVTTEVPSEEENKDMEEYAEFEGIVARKSSSEKHTILIIPNMDKQEVKNMLDKTSGMFRGKLIEEAVTYCVEPKEYEQVEIGTRVKIYYDSSKAQLESQPPIRTSEKMEVVTAD